MLAGLALVAVLPLTRLWVVRLRERRGGGAWGFNDWGEAAAGGEATGFGVCWGCWLPGCSEGKSSCVGDAFGPRDPCWLCVVTDSDEVAVVPVLCGAGSDILAVKISYGAREQLLIQCLYTPSGSLPTTELRPLQEWPRVLAYMAEPMLYKDEKERRLSASTSDLDLASVKEDG